MKEERVYCEKCETRMYENINGDYICPYCKFQTQKKLENEISNQEEKNGSLV